MTTNIAVDQKWVYGADGCYRYTIEAIHISNTGGGKDPGGDLIVLREDDGSLASRWRADFIANYRPVPVVWEVGKRYTNGPYDFTVTAVDADGHALIRHSLSGPRGRRLGYREAHERTGHTEA